MKKDRILVGLLVFLFLAGATSLLSAAPFIEPLEGYPDRGADEWGGPAYATPLEVKAEVGDTMGRKDIKEIEITAKGLGVNCGYMVMIKNDKGEMRMAEGPMGDTFVSDWSGEGSFILHIDSKIIKDFKYLDIYSQPGCSAAAGNKTEKVASVELK